MTPRKDITRHTFITSLLRAGVRISGGSLGAQGYYEVADGVHVHPGDAVGGRRAAQLEYLLAQARDHRPRAPLDDGEQDVTE